MKYICSVCGYVYDEEAEGVSFDSLPDSWVCPLCGAVKSDFEPEQTQEETEPVTAPEAAPQVEEEDLQELSVSQLSALFSNLARGCEKQYKFKEAELYTEIANYFDRISPAAESCELKDLADKVAENIGTEYPALEAEAKNAGDRGALRAYTWSNKVTKIQQTVISRYLQKGEALLEHTNIWVCTVCGFVYIGENPPALCPVCKVPDWKFEKM
ncbi:MAG: rubredoxin-like domain-containing protein [Candidatus Limivicinus sp.]|jgi:rubrerythrin